jgi:hypothetical protein
VGYRASINPGMRYTPPHPEDSRSCSRQANAPRQAPRRCRPASTRLEHSTRYLPYTAAHARERGRELMNRAPPLVKLLFMASWALHVPLTTAAGHSDSTCSWETSGFVLARRQPHPRMCQCRQPIDQVSWLVGIIDRCFYPVLQVALLTLATSPRLPSPGLHHIIMSEACRRAWRGCYWPECRPPPWPALFKL